MGATWQGDFECPQCGEGDKTLVDTARPDILREMGPSALVKCAICERQFLVKVKAK